MDEDESICVGNKPIDEAVVLEPPADDPTTTPSPSYELLITANKGYGLFATRDIKRGTRIIAEEPILIFPTHLKISDLHLSLDKLTPKQFEQLSDLASTERYATPDLTKAIQRRLLASGYRGLMLDAAVRDSVKMHCVFLTNNVDLGPDGRYGSGVFRDYSRINHSCRRNVHNAYNSTLGKMTVHAIRNIKAGEELLTSYLPAGVFIREERQEGLAKHWGIECECEVCDGPETVRCEQRRERLDEIMRGIAVYERQNPYLTALAPCPVPKDDSQALAWLEESVGLLKEEGLVGLGLADAYHSCSKFSQKCGQAAKALAYARKELEIEKVCLGDDVNHLEEGSKYAKLWIEQLGRLSEQEAVKDRMNQKREAKEQKREDKKAAKKAGKR